MCDKTIKTQSDEIQDLAAALCAAQTDELFALKDSTNPFFKSKYADLSSVWSAIRGSLTKNGLSVVQTTSEGSDGRINIITTLLHNSGQWIRGVLPIRPTKDDAQGLGSAITYGRRYGLSAIVGVCPDDDDGEGAVNRKRTNKSSPPKAKTAAAPTPKRQMFNALTEYGITEEKILSIVDFLKSTNEHGELTEETMLAVVANVKGYVNEWKAATGSTA